MTGAKWWFVPATVLAVIALAPAATAEEIDTFDIDVLVTPSTDLEISETIVYDFEGEQRRGIFRDIPVRDYLDDDSSRVYEVVVSSVSRDGNAEPFELSDEGDYLRVRIGDPDVEITGAHTYEIDYTVRNGLTTYTQEEADSIGIAEIEAGDVELYWDFVGGGWEVPIDQARVSVQGPATALAYQCFVGFTGSTLPCTVESESDPTVFSASRLYSGDALTGIVAFPGEAFTSPVEVVTEASQGARIALGILIGFFLAGLAIIVPTIVAVATRRGNKGAAVPLAPPQYSPPDGLTAAEIAAAWQGEDKSTSARAIVATLVDLAARRWIDLGQNRKKVTVTKRASGKDALRPWEESLLDSVVDASGYGTIDGYDATLATTWSASYSSLVNEARQSGRRNPEGGRPDQKWNFLAFTGITMFIVGIVFGLLDWYEFASVMIPASVGCLIGFGLARLITPRSETVQSAQFIAKVEGLKKVLGTDTSASRREFAHKLGLPDNAIFATMLPYAIIFDLDEAWTNAFPDLTAEQLNEYGFLAANAYMWSYLVSDFGRDIRTATTPPSRSSGSGFSGGSAGGGGGGGGGGSW